MLLPKGTRVKYAVILSECEGSRMVTLNVLSTRFFVANAPQNDRWGGNLHRCAAQNDTGD